MVNGKIAVPPISDLHSAGDSYVRSFDSILGADGGVQRSQRPFSWEAVNNSISRRSSAADRHAASVAPVIAEIRAAGITSLEGIAQALQARGVPTARGGRWRAQTVRNVLLRKGLN